MFEFGFHPLNLMVYTIGLGSILALLQIVIGLRYDDDALFGFAAVSLLSWLSAFSFLSGFSIGWLVSMITTVLGIIFIVTSKRYQTQIIIATAISALLVVSLRGWFDYARPILWGLIIGLVIFCGYLVNRALQKPDKGSVGPLLLVIIASISGLSLIVLGSAVITIGLTALSIGLTIPALVYIKRYRLELGLIFIATALWLVNGFLQI